MATRLYMSMSLDGFIAGPNEGPGNGLGDGGARLHEWVFPSGFDDNLEDVAKRLTGANRTVYDEMMATGAVVAGRGTVEPAEGWGGDHHDGVPMWIWSRHDKPAAWQQWPLIRYEADLAAAMRDARAAAGGKDVMVHGAGVAPRAIREGLLDEMEIHLVPVLFGGGRPLFETLGIGQQELERVRVLEGDRGMVHLRYRVRR